VAGIWRSVHFFAENCIGDLDGCERVRLRILPLLKVWVAAERATGYALRILDDREAVYDEMLDESDLMDRVGDRLPVLWLQLAYRPPALTPDEVSAFAANNGLAVLFSRDHEW
jgi:hypothetical protein